MKAPRINRYLSQAGLGSRRAVESLLREGRVSVNGLVVRDLATRVDPVNDRVEVDGKTVRVEESGVTLLLNKPRGVVSSFRRQGSSSCLREILPPEVLQGRLFHVGRLDRDSSGLLLLSDDGDLAHALLHPSHPVWKRYEVEFDGPLKAEEMQLFQKGGIVLSGRACAPARIKKMGSGKPALYEVELREGRNRQIRRMAREMGRRVLHLHRTAFGPVELGEVEVGKLRPLTEAELQALRVAAGLRSELT